MRMCVYMCVRDRVCEWWNLSLSQSCCVSEVTIQTLTNPSSTYMYTICPEKWVAYNIHGCDKHIVVL